VLYEILGEDLFEDGDLFPVQSFTVSERAMLRQMMSRGFNSPWTSSAGRLFDAVASLVGLHQRISFEGQAAIELEFAIQGEPADGAYSFLIHEGAVRVIDWEPMVLEILDDTRRGAVISRIAGKFHNTLAEMIVAVAKRVGEERVLLTGGCFQNRYLTERTVHRLGMEGFRPYWHQRVPPNDGGIALGQVFAVLRKAAGKTLSTHTR
jgi:hydrogenase maturation protein HypF